MTDLMPDEGVDVVVCIGELPDSLMQAIRVGQVRCDGRHASQKAHAFLDLAIDRLHAGPV